MAERPGRGRMAALGPGCRKEPAMPIVGSVVAPVAVFGLLKMGRVHSVL